MTRINGNSGDKDLQALKAYYEALNSKKINKEEKTEDVKPIVDFKTKKVDVSALDATAAQIWGVQLSNVDKSEAATLQRLEKGFTNSPFIASLNDLQGIKQEKDFSTYAMQNIKGCDPDKLQKYMNLGLNAETTNKVADYLDTLTV